MPKRLAVLIALCDHLKKITPTNGYESDLSEAVFRGRSIIGAERPPNPMISIIEAPRPDVALFGGERKELRHDQWTLLIQGTSDDDKTNPSDSAYHLCAEVEMQLARINATRSETGSPLYPQEWMLGGLISSLEIAPPVVRPPEDRVSASAYFFLPIRLGVAVETGRPYTAA
jgi:hypothetical protein